MIDPDNNIDHFGYTGTGSGADDLADFNQCESDDYREADTDDTVKYCPDCETPNQFGELCEPCRRERDLEHMDSSVDYETDAERNR